MTCRRVRNKVVTEAAKVEATVVSDASTEGIDVKFRLAWENDSLLESARNSQVWTILVTDYS